MIHEIRAELLEKQIEKLKELNHILSEMASYASCVTNPHMLTLREERKKLESELASLEQEQEEQSKGIGRIMSNPKECGYRSRNPYLIDDTFSCLNPKDKNTVCYDPEKFPDNCPLQAYRTEGIRKEYHDESAEFLSDI
jgi:predicted HTH domain antitoxin